MKKLHLILIIVLLVSSCKKRIATKEQCDRYESFKEVLSNNKEYLHLIEKQGDSAKTIISDVITLTLDEIVEKHQIEKSDIDKFLNSLSISVELINTFEKLNSAFEKQNKIFNNSISEIESSLNILESKKSFDRIIIDTTKHNVIVNSYDTTDSN